jgi:hypothetical protein
VIEYYGRERYRFFVVFMIEGGAFAIAGAAGVDCEGGRDAGGIESGLGAAALGEGLTKSAQTATNARMSRDMVAEQLKAGRVHNSNQSIDWPDKCAQERI